MDQRNNGRIKIIEIQIKESNKIEISPPALHDGGDISFSVYYYNYYYKLSKEQTSLM
jgi:hypothetical protein